MPLHINRDISTTQEEVLGDNPARTYALLQNDDSVNNIWLSLGVPAVANQGIFLKAGGGAFEITLVNPWKGRIYAIASAASTKLMVTEY